MIICLVLKLFVLLYYYLCIYICILCCCHNFSTLLIVSLLLFYFYLTNIICYIHTDWEYTKFRYGWVPSTIRETEDFVPVQEMDFLGSKVTYFRASSMFMFPIYAFIYTQLYEESEWRKLILEEYPCFEHPQIVSDLMS